MRTEPRRWPSIGTATAAIAALGAVVIGAAWYVGDGDTAPSTPVDLGGKVRLVAYDSCDAALADLKRAGLAKVGPWGLEAPHHFARGMAVEDSATAAGAPEQDQGGFSTTNVHEAAADEPDLVKTDGKRIVSVVDGKLRIVDVAARSVSTTIPLDGHAHSVLVSGDRALVAYSPEHKPATSSFLVERGGLALVDLAAGKVLRTLTVDGMHIDARMVGSTARVVVRSAPRFEFAYPHDGVSESTALSRNRGIIERSTIKDWLPRFELSPGGTEHLDCAALSRPSGYTGTSMLTVLSVDLLADLSARDSVAIAADGDTVYGTGTSLYVADDRTPRWSGAFTSDLPMPMPSQTGPAKTDVHQFDVSAPGKPVYLASGSVEGWLLNQYSLSEHEGRLRIATTTGGPTRGPAAEDAPPSESAVVVLERKDKTLTQVGRVGGLGKNEQIYSVRYLGDTAYVVTFRRTDPLYAVDLSDPTAPKVTGELKITGFSAYLHPLGDGRLLGVGQEATDEGRATGVQVSLFDVSGPTPTRITQFHQPDSYSMAEHDPHAFLHFPERDLVVLPISGHDGTGGATLLRVAGDTITVAGRVTNPGRHGEITRAVIAGGALWTFGYEGVQASDLDTLARLAWMPFPG